MICVTEIPHWLQPQDRFDTAFDCCPGICARDLAPKWAKPGAPWLVAMRNGRPIEAADWGRQLSPNDHLVFGARPGFDPVTITILGTGISFTAPAIAVGIGALAVAAGLGYAVQALVGLSEPPTKPGDDSSSTYSFLNLQANNYGNNAAIPVGYGRHRMAPPVINQFVRNFLDGNGDPISEVLMLLNIGEGSVQAIGDKTANGGPFTDIDGNLPIGIQIENQPAENFAGIEAHVRLGTFDQTPIPGFADTVQQFDVDTTLRESETSDPPEDVEATPGVYGPADPEITKWDTQGAYTMGEESDSFTAVMSFAQGLYRIDGSGNIVKNEVDVQIRYRRVDGGGVPFGNYVVLPKEPTVSVAKRGPFAIEFTHRFKDDADFAPPDKQFFMDCPASLSPVPEYTIGSTLLDPAPGEVEFSFHGWYRWDESGSFSTTTLRTVTLFDWMDDANNEGFRLKYEGTLSSGRLVLELGDGSSKTLVGSNFGSGATEIVDGNFHHIAITYKANADEQGNGRIRQYIDGTQKKKTKLTMIQPFYDVVQSMGFGGVIDETLVWDGGIQEVQVFQRELTPFEISSKFNSGRGVAGDAGESELVIGVRFGTLTASGGSSFASDVYGPASGAAVGVLLGPDPQVAGNAAITTGTNFGVVDGPESGTDIKDKFLIEIQRINAEDTGNAVDEITWALIQLTTDQEFEYPGMALLAIRIQATDQLSTGRPLVTTMVSGQKVPIWDGVDPLNPSAPLTWSRNPAWILLDMITNPVYGLGLFYKLTEIDMPAWNDFATFCDTKVYDASPRLEPTLIAADDTVTVDFPNGFFEFTVPATGYPKTWPGVTSSVQPNDEVTGLDHWFAIVNTDLDLTPPPTFVTDIDGVAHRVGEVTFDQASNVYKIKCHATTTPPVGTPTYSPPASTIEVERNEPRMRYDGIFDRQDVTAWDAILQVARSARAVPIHKGAQLSIFFDDVRQPSAFFGMGNIIEGSWRTEFSGLNDRPNAESTDFFDEALNYERSPAALEHPDVNDPATFSAFRWRRIKIEGIVRRSQIMRHLLRDLNTFNLIRRLVEFDVGIDAIPLRPGQMFEHSHDVPAFGESGKVWADSAGDNTIKLDREIVIANAKTYEIIVVDQATGDRETQAVDIAVTVPATYPAGSTITMVTGFSFKPQQDDLYAFGETTRASKQFSIIETTLDPVNLVRHVVAVEYDVNSYGDDFGELPDTSGSLLQPPRPSDIPPPPEDLQIDEESCWGPGGEVCIDPLLTWEWPTMRGQGFGDGGRGGGGGRISVGSVRIWIAEGRIVGTVAHDGAEYWGEVHGSLSSVRLTGYPFVADQTYTIIVQPVSQTGATTLRKRAALLTFSPKGLAPLPPTLTGLDAAVAGEQTLYTWDRPDVDLVRMQAIEARRGGWVLGDRMFSTPAQAEQFGPTSDWVGTTDNNLGIGDLPIYFRSRLGNGQYGEAALLTPTPDVVGAEGDSLESSREDLNYAGTLADMTLELSIGVEGMPVIAQLPKLKPDDPALTHSYTFTPVKFDEPQWVYLQVVVGAYQIHPETIEEIAARGALQDPDVARWMIEGPTHTREGEVENASMRIQIAHSDNATPGTDFRDYRPGYYRLRSMTIRILFTRPNTSYDFRLYRVGVRVTKVGEYRRDHIAARVFGPA